MQKQVNEIMQKEMSRREFLAALGFGVASVFGLGTILRLLGHQQSASAGYGSSSYGGLKKH
jgi:hypothetical protein